MNKAITRKIISLVWFIVSIVLVIIGFKENNNLILSIIVGQLFVGFGALIIEKNFGGWIITDLGLIILSYPITKILEYEIAFQNSMKYSILTFCLLIAIELFFDDYIKNKSVKKRCTEPLQAKCVSFENSIGTNYIPVYKYNIDGKINMFYGNCKSNLNAKLGDVITIFVNNKNQDDIYCPTSKALLMIRYLIGTGLLAFTIGGWLAL